MQRIVFWLARILAILGGIVLTVLILLTCVSVLGRGGNTFGHSDFLNGIAPGIAEAFTRLGPVKGDFEIVEAGIAFSVFAFLPWCQLRQGHATVDVFTSYLSERLNRAIMVFWELLFALTLILISWRLFEGMIGKVRNGETTFLLQFPIWWAYAASFVASVIAALVGVYTAWERAHGLIIGREVLPASGGSAH
ncbi:TRAP transporter small permease [Ostreiculturibacter nitratireducens]|uniref:TRAP transporter small permease n=1 Tax=Ostreiculturibacter nitratireducens TaxID=3075226 RepID=UPI0031B5C3ED